MTPAKGSATWLRETFDMVERLRESARITEATYQMHLKELARERDDLDAREARLRADRTLVEAFRARADALEREAAVFQRDDVRRLLAIRRRLDASGVDLTDLIDNTEANDAGGNA